MFLSSAARWQVKVEAGVWWGSGGWASFHIRLRSFTHADLRSSRNSQHSAGSRPLLL